MKKCKKCGIELAEEEDFSWWESETIGLCNDCYLKALDEWTPENEFFKDEQNYC